MLDETTSKHATNLILNFLLLEMGIAIRANVYGVGTLEERDVVVGGARRGNCFGLGEEVVLFFDQRFEPGGMDSVSGVEVGGVTKWSSRRVSMESVATIRRS